MLVAATGCGRVVGALSDDRGVALFEAIDRLPVTAIVTGLGQGTARVDANGDLLTVSHLIPRGCVEGEAWIGGMAGCLGVYGRYRVLDSGARLEVDCTERWSEGGDGGLLDWARLRFIPESGVAATPRVDSLHCGGFEVSTEIPGHVREFECSSPAVELGEQLVFVGFTSPDGELVRHTMTVEVIGVPRRFRRTAAAECVWFRALGGGRVRQGFSGGWLWRLGADDVLEPYAMVVERGMFRDNRPTGIGVAIRVP